MNDQSNGQKLFLTRLRRHRITVLISRVLILTVFLFLWELCARFEIIDSFIFSSPSKITLCFLEMLKNRSLFLHIGITLSALAPLLIVWLGATSKTIIIAGMSVAIFGSILNLYTAFINVDQEKIKLIYTLHGNRRHALTKVVLPSSVPAIISNMKVNIGLCLVGVIIGEFLAAKSGLGYLIIYSSQVFKMDWLLMSIILLCIMAMGLYALINVVEKRVLKKY